MSQQILADDQVRAERSKMVQREKAEFFKAGNSQEGDKQPSGTSHIQDVVNEQSGNGNDPEADKPPPEEHNIEPLSKLAVWPFLL